jgi:hypothetical protein
LNILDTDTHTWQALKLKVMVTPRSKWNVFSHFSGHTMTLVGSNIFCIGGCFNEKYNTVVRYMETGTTTTLSSDMKDALVAGDFADLTFHFPNEKLSSKCHKIVLSARSAKFRVIFAAKNIKTTPTFGEESLRTQDDVIEITDIPYEYFNALIRLCYTDELEATSRNLKQVLALVKEYIPSSYRRILSCLIQTGKLPSLMGQDFKANALNNRDYSDITFVVEGEEVHCHKVIVASRCSQFQAMFFSGMKESTQDKIEVPDIRLPIFKLMLEFLYTDTLDIRINIMGGSGSGSGGGVEGSEMEEGLSTPMSMSTSTSTNEVSPNDIVELLGVANLYTLDKLKQICEDQLLKFVDEENVVVLFQAATLFHAERLRASCFKFLLKRYESYKASKTSTSSMSSMSSMSSIGIGKGSTSTTGGDEEGEGGSSSGRLSTRQRKDNNEFMEAVIGQLDPWVIEQLEDMLSSKQSSFLAQLNQ